MALEGHIIRPPSEAESFLLQVTTGCSSDACVFCGAYTGKPFRVKNIEEVYEDIQKAGKSDPEIRRVFLLDGDALVLNNKKLLPILEKINEAFPKLTRISSYANGYNITGRSCAEMAELYEHKIRVLYMGLESGDQDILNYCRKRSTVNEMIEAVNKCGQFKIKTSVILLLGLGGRKYSKQHVENSIITINKMQPNYLSFLSLMIIPGTPLYEEKQNGNFIELNPSELLQETHDIIEGLELKNTIFRSDHASNYLPLGGRFPRDKPALLDILRSAIRGKVALRQEFMRGL
ncbi:MAG: radical SAM protein [bacterium]|nr:radical SAM protein [bacterium]